jgi:hypothetical protein
MASPSSSSSSPSSPSSSPSSSSSPEEEPEQSEAAGKETEASAAAAEGEAAHDDASTAHLPLAALLGVSLVFVTDPEPLLTLSQRTRTLMSLASTCHELYEVVWRVALPRLQAAALSGCLPRPYKSSALPPKPPRPGAAGPEDNRHREALTLAGLARATDTEVRGLHCALLPGAMATSANQAWSRVQVVDSLLWCAGERQRRLAPLWAELAWRRSALITRSAARFGYRLRVDQVRALPSAAEARSSNVRDEDAADAALARHGGAAALAAYDAAQREAARRRAVAVQRREALDASLAASLPRWTEMVEAYPDLADARRRLLRTGDDAPLRELHRERLAAIEDRRAALAALGWRSPEDDGPSSCPERAAALRGVQRERHAFLMHGRSADGMAVGGLLLRWDVAWRELWDERAGWTPLRSYEVPRRVLHALRVFVATGADEQVVRAQRAAVAALEAVVEHVARAQHLRAQHPRAQTPGAATLHAALCNCLKNWDGRESLPAPEVVVAVARQIAMAT